MGEHKVKILGHNHLDAALRTIRRGVKKYDDFGNKLKSTVRVNERGFDQIKKHEIQVFDVNGMLSFLGLKIE